MRSKKQRTRVARQRLRTAREQWSQAAVHSWEPADPAECITKSFYSFENALSAALIATGRKETTRHYEKADLAAKLVADGILNTNIRKRLVELNDLRKDVQYGEPGAQLANTDLDDVVSELEAFLDEVESVIDDIEGK